MDPVGVRQAYEKYYQKTGQYPYSWKEMVDGKILNTAPMGKNGQPLDFVQFTYWHAGYPAK